MGLFLGMSSVVNRPLAAVVDSLTRFTESHGGSMEAHQQSRSDERTVVALEHAGHTNVLYPYGFASWDLGSQHLSRDLDTPVFSFHIHDGDLWMYVLYDKGLEVDQFNPVPDYWAELDDVQRQAWRGDAAKIAAAVPGAVPSQIERYLVHWGDEVFESDVQTRAYPDDRYFYGDDWQLVDFMSKLGFKYPVDDQGVPQGPTFRFQCSNIY